METGYQNVSVGAGHVVVENVAQDINDAGEESYRLLINNQTDLVVKLDRDGRLLFVNPSYCETFSRAKSELYGTKFEEQIHNGDIESVEREWRNLFAKPWTSRFEHRASTASGNRWLGWVLKAVRNEAGDIVEIVGVGRDVTARRNAEEQARQHLHTLAHAGRLHSMGEMATNLAHELNQPLTAILSFAQAIQRVIRNHDFDHDELVFAVERIAANAARAGDIIGHMRGFIRNEESCYEISGINQLITRTMDLVNSELLQLEIDVELILDELVPDVRVDPIQIQQVILNLVRNSMDAIDNQVAGERRIRIATQVNKPGSIEVTVNDSGPGLPAEVKKRLFDAFVTTKSEGMGVGLSICKSIVEAHRGSLVYHKNSGPGATFSFVLPSLGEGGET